jgi:predicted nuclease of predicted toxin-antitoxin system
LDLREADDESIWQYAASHGSVIITKDEDFASRVWQTSSGPAVVWLRIGNCSNRELLDHLIPLLDAVAERIQLGDRLVEVS